MHSNKHYINLLVKTNKYGLNNIHIFENNVIKQQWGLIEGLGKLIIETTQESKRLMFNLAKRITILVLMNYVNVDDN